MVAFDAVKWGYFLDDRLKHPNPLYDMQVSAVANERRSAMTRP
jgi:hypothetical protein